jgi:hypothetical protein
MKLAGLCALLGTSLIASARADLTIVQKVEGNGPVAEMIIKVKGDKARVEATPEETTLFDGKTGEMIRLLNTQKAVVRVSAEKMKAAAEMVNKFAPMEKGTGKAKLTPSGKKEKISGYESEEYVYETPDLKAAYWIAPKYPDGAAILKEMQSLKMDAWSSGSAKMPDYSDFPGVPIKTVVTAGGNQVTSTITSIKREPLSDAEFSVPKDFHEIKTPEITTPGGENEKPPASASPGR